MGAMGEAFALLPIFPNLRDAKSDHVASFTNKASDASSKVGFSEQADTSNSPVLARSNFFKVKFKDELERGDMEPYLRAVLFVVIAAKFKG